MADARILETVRVELGERSYDIEIGQGNLGTVGDKMKALGLKGRAGIVTNDAVSPLYARAVSESISAAGIEPVLLVIPDGEEYKSLP